MSKKTGLLVRLLRLLRLLGWFYATAKRLRGLSQANAAQREDALRVMSISCLNILNVGVQVMQPERLAQHNVRERGVLIAANHVSWLDILVITSLMPASFIAMQEIRHWFMIGKMVSNAGTVYIDRSSRKDIDVINAAISRVLEAGGRVCFFPEARTTLGNGVLPMKAALFQAALDSQAPVQPLALRYYDNEHRTQAVSFAGVNLLRSLWQILAIERIEVRVDVGDWLEPEAVGEGGRYMLKDLVEAYIKPIVLSDSPSPDAILPTDN